MRSSSEVLEQVMGYLTEGLHTITIGMVDAQGRPYTKCMDILSAQPYGGVYIYGENTWMLDACLAQSPYVAFSGITGCAFSREREINFTGKLEKVDEAFAKELIACDTHVAELLDSDSVKNAMHGIGIYHVYDGNGTLDDIYAGIREFAL